MMLHFHIPVSFASIKAGNLPPFELYWYDGGMKPCTPDEMEGKPLEREGMMFVGEKGKIIAGFRCEEPKLLPASKMEKFLKGKEAPKEVVENGEKYWVNAFKTKTQSPGSFLNATAVTETILPVPLH
jgi:hypothetical protein